MAYTFKENVLWEEGACWTGQWVETAPKMDFPIFTHSKS